MFKINDKPVEIERYPDETPRLNVVADSGEAVIEWFYEKDEEILLFFIVKHLREQYAPKNLTLYMPYIPHARMDRVKNQEEVFTLRYFCDFINSLCFDQVVVRDAHSAVSLSMLNNVVSEPIDKNIKKLIAGLLDAGKDIVFYPDEGSRKRYSELIDIPCAYGVKKRDWDTGKILGLDVRGNLPASSFDVVIIDDISSYGGTFLHSARKLKELGANKIYLYVTHCEDSILSGELINSGLL
ncbi:MAG: hypothetical protein FWE54_06690, partial [Methanimicrococcus sp.]|nr:hypothetical protein [Methanimicrococcus sp.]